jgi:hypothetical protein
MSARAQNTLAAAITAPEIVIHDHKESRAVRQAKIDALQIRLDEAESVTRDLQAQVSYTIQMAHPMNPSAPRAVALRDARDHANELRAQLDEMKAALDREILATVPDRFAECAKAFGAEVGPNGWASCSEVPADALAACLEPMIVALAANQASVSRIFNQVQNAVGRAVPAACSPFMPSELFDTSSPVRGVIYERIRRAVK